jgi:hypothetical protein
LSHGQTTLRAIHEKVRKVAEELREKRMREALKRARSFREYLQYRVNYLVWDVCSKFGIVGSRMLDYLGFAKKVVYDWYNAHVEYTVNPELVNIDDIFDYYEKYWAIPRGLDPNVVKELELAILDFIQNIDKMREDFEKLRRELAKEV